MPKPLRPGDPGEIGPFHIESRLHESPAGIVYLGADAAGRRVSVALLTTAAAGDAAARDRFRAAIAAETPPPDPVPHAPPVPGPGEPAPILAALPEGDAPWVATGYEEGRAGAERFLEPVLLRHGWGFRGRRGPQFQPYWASRPSGPALRTARPAGEGRAALGDSRGLAAAVLSLVALLALLVLLVALLFSCEPDQPVPPPTDTPTVSPFTPEPTPSSGSPLPTPSPGRSSPTVRPSPTGGGRFTGNPAVVRRDRLS